jgi:hypothetical protein
MKVLFVAGFGPIVRDQNASEPFYLDSLGLSFVRNNDYLFTDKLNGVKHFALWPLAQAAQSCFGSDTWPKDVPIPQAWLEFDVEDVEAATLELEQKGYKLLVSNRTEPWGQIITRLISPEGILLGIGFTPWMK